MIAVLAALAFALIVAALAGFLPGLGAAVLAALGLTLAAGWSATAANCGADFLAHLTQDGRCAASDWPSEVFGSFLMLAGVLAFCALLSGRALRRFLR